MRTDDSIHNIRKVKLGKWGEGKVIAAAEPYRLQEKIVREKERLGK